MLVECKLKTKLNLNHRYTVTEATLKGNDKTCKLPFALIFEENGVYFLETFLIKDFYQNGDFSSTFDLFGITEKGYEIEIKDLTFTNYQYNNYKAKFVCRNFIKLTEKGKSSIEDSSDDIDDSILFIEIEGFNTKFANHTKTKSYRQYGEIDDFNLSFDYTSCLLIIDINGFRENRFQLIFSKSKKNDNTLIDFTKTDGYNRLSFAHFQSFKKQFISFLSMINGGNVIIRKELAGNSHRIDGSDSQIVYNYSFLRKANSYTSDYIPIDEHHSYSSLIFSHIFLNCFNSFYHYDQKFDLTSTIYSINSSYTTSGIQQAYSILINALEKFSSNYHKSINILDEDLIELDIWEKNLKDPFLKILEDNKSAINSKNKNAYVMLKSKIGELNRRKNSTVQKMYELLEFGCIPINENVENLVTKERHTAVHNGEFGLNDEEMYVNYQKLDHILRDLILNIIGYKSYRKSILEYASKEERSQALIKKENK
jgi:hypothetical protein